MSNSTKSTRATVAAAHEAATAELRRFENEHVETLRRHRELETAVHAAVWPPRGFEECYFGDEECDALFPEGNMPEGWVEKPTTCGCGNGTFLCPTHAHTAKATGGCSRCSR